MKTKALLAGLAVAAATLCASAASATVLTFDDLSGSGQLADGYQGITWNGQWTYYDAAQDPYNPASGAERIFNFTADGERPQDAAFSFGSAVVFDGAYFAGVDITNVNFDLYLGASLVHSSAAYSPNASPAFLASGYSGLVDKVVVHDTGFDGLYDYYVMDDVTFHSAVPEPITWALMVGGFGMAGAALRRRRAIAAA